MVRRLCIKFCTASINCLVSRDDTKGFAIRANCHFVFFKNVCKLTIGETESLCTTYFMSTQLGQGLPFQRMTLINDDLHLVEEPHINFRCIVNSINAHASVQSFAYLEDSLGRSNRCFLQEFLVTEGVVQRFPTVTVQTKPALLK